MWAELVIATPTGVFTFQVLYAFLYSLLHCRLPRWFSYCFTRFLIVIMFAFHFATIATVGVFFGFLQMHYAIALCI